MTFYQDWTFWSFACAAIAVALSQLPPIRAWRRKVAISVDAYSHIMVGHNIGHPVLQLHLSITNTGTRDVRIQGIKVRCKRQGSSDIDLVATAYFAKDNIQSSLLLTPFTLSPKQEWSHVLVLSRPLSRQESKLLREAISSTQETIERQHLESQARGESHGSRLFEASSSDIEKLDLVFERAFCWFEMNYLMELEVFDSNSRVLATQRYRFTLFDSDERLLRSFKEDYKLGAGVYFAPRKQQVYVSIERAESSS